MYRYAIKMLFGDNAKFYGILLGLGFASLLIAQQASIFVGLMSRTFAELDTAGSGGVDKGRAAAFQRAMQAVRNNPAHREWAHPSFWAAFSFIGDPG